MVRKIMNDKLDKFLEKIKTIFNNNSLIKETEIEGFIYGEYTDHFDFDEEVGCTFGDGFVQAPDRTIAGIIWEVADQPYLSICMEPEKDRWGVYNVWFVKPIKTIDDLVYNIKIIFPLIKEAYVNAKGK